LVTADSVKARFFRDAFGTHLLDNTVRGLWCEFMIAEALGPECSAVGLGWHPWDLQIGPDAASMPERIRIQIKNSAALQSWNVASGTRTKCSYSLTWRRPPAYFSAYFPHTPCEDAGFLCDVFVLCHHPVEDPERADHRDPTQWRFFLVPVVGPNVAITEAEVASRRTSLERTGTPSVTQRTPLTLAAGIRGRPPVPPLDIDELTVDAIRRSLGVGPQAVPGTMAES